MKKHKNIKPFVPDNLEIVNIFDTSDKNVRPAKEGNEIFVQPADYMHIYYVFKKDYFKENELLIIGTLTDYYNSKIYYEIHDDSDLPF